MNDIIFDFMKRKETIEVAQPVPDNNEINWVKELSKGLSNKEASEVFGVNENTFAFRIAELRRRYNCPNTVALVVYFKDNGLI